ncbi:MAG: IclR family transcriptional regulator [Rhizobiaceae bacterium]|nr:IclR family transcriptional regulator [Rhizobiaceae bacterium]
MAGGKTEGDRKFVVALARGLEVLRAFRPSDGMLGNKEIAERTGLPRPTVTRITYTLCQLGYLARIARFDKYSLAPSAITIGYAALAGFGLRRVARPFMEDVARDLSAPVALGVIDRSAVLYVDIARGTAAFTIQLEIGSRLPLLTTAMGRALLAATPPAERAAILEPLRASHGTDWPAIEAELEAAYASCARDGYTSVTAAWRSDIHSVAVPLVAHDGSGVYAFNCGGPPHQFTADFMRDRVAPAMLGMKARIEAALDGGFE